MTDRPDAFLLKLGETEEDERYAEEEGQDFGQEVILQDPDTPTFTPHHAAVNILPTCIEQDEEDEELVKAEEIKQED